MLTIEVHGCIEERLEERAEDLDPNWSRIGGLTLSRGARHSRAAPPTTKQELAERAARKSPPPEMDDQIPF